MSDPANRLPPEYDETLPVDYDPQFTADISTKMRVPDKIAVSASDDEEDTDGESHRKQIEEELRRVAAMNVPDRITLQGNNRNEAVNRDPRDHMHLDFTSFSSFPTSTQSSYVGLQTPPRVLTLDDQPFPGNYKQMNEDQIADDDINNIYTGDEEEDVDMKKRQHNVSFQNGYVTPAKQQHVPLPKSINSVVSFPITDYISKWFNSFSGPSTTHFSDHGILVGTPGEGLLIDADEEDDMQQLRRQVAKLHRHVQRLEEENSKRNSREVLLYPAIVGYFLFKLVNWFMKQH